MHHVGMSNKALVLSPVNQEKVTGGLMIYRAQKGIARVVEYKTLKLISFCQQWFCPLKVQIE